MSDSLVVAIGVGLVIFLVCVIIAVIIAYVYIYITGEKSRIRNFDKWELAIHWFSELSFLGTIFAVIDGLKDGLKEIFAGGFEWEWIIGILIYAVILFFPNAGMIMCEKEIYDKYVEHNPDEAIKCYGLSLLLSFVTLPIMPIVVFCFVCKMFFESIFSGVIEVDNKSSVNINEPFEFRRDRRGNKYYNFNDNYVKDEHGELHEVIDDGAGNKYIKDDPWELHRDENDRLR